MPPRTLLAASLLVLTSLPAAAEFCSYKSGTNSAAGFRELDKPFCKTQDNSFRFGTASPSVPEYWSKDGSTYVSDNMPGWMGADQQCAKAVTGAKVVLYRTETYLVAYAVSGPRVFKYKGTCSSLKYKFLAKLAEVGRGEPTEDTVETALLGVGAEEVGAKDMLSRLIEIADKEAEKKK